MYPRNHVQVERNPEKLRIVDDSEVVHCSIGR